MTPARLAVALDRSHRDLLTGLQPVVHPDLEHLGPVVDERLDAGVDPLVVTTHHDHVGLGRELGGEGLVEATTGRRRQEDVAVGQRLHTRLARGSVVSIVESVDGENR